MYLLRVRVLVHITGCNTLRNPSVPQGYYVVVEVVDRVSPPANRHLHSYSRFLASFLTIIPKKDGPLQRWPIRPHGGSGGGRCCICPLLFLNRRRPCLRGQGIGRHRLLGRHAPLLVFCPRPFLCSCPWRPVPRRLRRPPLRPSLSERHGRLRPRPRPLRLWCVSFCQWRVSLRVYLLRSYVFEDSTWQKMRR